MFSWPRVLCEMYGDHKPFRNVSRFASSDADNRALGTSDVPREIRVSQSFTVSVNMRTGDLEEIQLPRLAGRSWLDLAPANRHEDVMFCWLRNLERQNSILLPG